MFTYQWAAHITHCWSMSVAPQRNEHELIDPPKYIYHVIKSKMHPDWLVVHISTCHGQLYGIASWPPTIRVSCGGIGVRPQSSTAYVLDATIARIMIADWNMMNWTDQPTKPDRTQIDDRYKQSSIIVILIINCQWHRCDAPYAHVLILITS